MENCIFCKIISGEIPCDKVYEDDSVIAFLDANPVSKGHTLVLPKEHFENIFDIPDDLLCKVISVAKKMSLKIKDVYNPDGIAIDQNNGVEAGQSVFHLHIHVKPVFKNAEKMDISSNEMKQIADDLRI